MSLSNRITIDDAAKMPVGDLVSLPNDQLILLLEEIDVLKEKHKTIDALLASVLLAKFGERGRAVRRAEGKDHGIVHFSDAEFEISDDLPKKIDWDQPRLRNIVRHIGAEMKEDPSDYVTFEIKVSETKYNAWPEKIKSLFTPARTVKGGKRKITIKHQDAA